MESGNRGKTAGDQTENHINGKHAMSEAIRGHGQTRNYGTRVQDVGKHSGRDT